MSEHQAQDLLLQAERKLNSWTWFNSTNKQEDAAEIYEKAGNTFKLAQRCMWCTLYRKKKLVNRDFE
jgi:alpha-soluble NSF attachment protein